MVQGCLMDMDKSGDMDTEAARPGLWLVRHGETNWNALGWVQGQTDGSRLTRNGRRQIRRVATLLEDQGIECVYSSDLHRALQTAEIVAERLGREIRIDRQLRERSFGTAEGAPSTRLSFEYTGIRKGKVVDARARFVGGESLLEVHNRCAQFLHRLSHRPPGGDVAVIAHGGSIRMLRACMEGMHPTGMPWETVENASIHRVPWPRPAVAEPAVAEPAPVSTPG
ncbi:MAG: histidine phosphatase family protein [Acidimicrobiales bacterium]|jgi:probable phosphoglycerate mutase